MAKLVYPSPIQEEGGSFARNSVASYIDSDGILRWVAANILRIWHRDGVLIEGVGVNYVPRSEEFNNGWTTSNVTVTANAREAPDGTMTADRITGSNATSTIGRTFSQGIGVANTLSGFAEADSLSAFRLIEVGSGAYIDVDLAAKTVTPGGGASNPKLELLRGSIYRASFRYTSAGGTGTWRVVLGVGSIYLWGAMAEAGAEATSYIKTEGAGANRSADVLSGSAMGFLYSSVPANEIVVDGAAVTVSAHSMGTDYLIGDYALVDDSGTSRAFRSLQGEKHTFTVSIAGDYLSVPGLTRALPIGALVTFTTTNALPGGISAATPYFVVQSSPGFLRISATQGGSVLDITSTGTGTHTLIVSTNIGNDPLTSPTYWEEAPAPSRMAMYDGEVNTQTVAVDEIVTAFAPSRINNLVFDELEGETLTLWIYSRVGGVYVLEYTETVELVPPGTEDWELPIKRRRVVPFPDLDTFETLADPLVIVSIRGDGVVKCGIGHAGVSFFIGRIGWGCKFGLTSATNVAADQWGRLDPVKLPPWKLLSGELVMRSEEINFNDVARIRKDLLDVPTYLLLTEDEAVLDFYVEGGVVYGILDGWDFEAVTTGLTRAPISFRGLI